MNSLPQPLMGYRKYWAHKFTPAPVLPMSRAEMDELGWDSCDIILVTGDAYVDHPGFGLSCHIGAWRGTDEEKDQADREVAPWVCTTHIDWRICTGPMLREKLANLWDAGYDGYYCVEHHSGKDEYREVAIQLALVRNELELMAGRK